MNKKLDIVQKLLVCGFFLFVSTDVKAQITPDSTLRGESSKITPNAIINGANADLINGGALRGNNLFHSFSEFNIKDEQRVYFGNPSGVVNILTRVTGRNVSNILGTLGVDGAANLFLINPNGILFGKNASLDVRGSFVGTTANGVQFGNQGNFSATNAEAPGLLTVNPSALFFNQINPNAAIVNNSVAPAGIDPAGFRVFGLRVPDGKSLLLVGGDVSIDGGELNAYGGRIELGGLTSDGSVNLFFDENNLRLGFPAQVTYGTVTLRNQAFVYVEASGGGDIAVNAQNIEILGGSVLSAGIGEGLKAPTSIAGDINLNATGEIKVEEGSTIRNLVQSASQGNGGNINIIAGSLKLQDGAQLVTSTYGQGNAGNVDVLVVDVADMRGVRNGFPSAIFTNVEAGAKGNGGNINFKAHSFKLQDGAGLFTSSFGKGNAGNVNVTVVDVADIRGVKDGFPSAIFTRVETGAEGKGGDIKFYARSFKLQDGAGLFTSSFGKGNAGNVNVTVVDVADIRGVKDGRFSSIFTSVETGAKGNGGNINFQAHSFKLQDGAGLFSSSFGKGDAGNVDVLVTDAADIRGVKDEFPSAIFTRVETGAEGKGGDIKFYARSFKLQDGAQINASTLGQGSAGNVTVTVKDAIQVANANILSAVEAGGVGRGGNVDINAATLSLIDGAQILTSTFGASDTQPPGKGSAGNVNVKVSFEVTIIGVKDGRSSAIFSSVSSGTEGNGGNININAGSFKVLNGAILDARTNNNNRGGDISVNTNLFEALTGGQLVTTSLTNGRAGKITVNATDKVIISSNDPNYNDRVNKFPGRTGNIGANAGFFVNSTGAGTTGDIEINSPNITLDNQGRLQANSASGNGGNINLNSDLLLLRRGAQISTNAGTEQKGGDGGNIDIDSRFIVAVLKENSDITANAFTGRGGNVNIRAQGIFGIEPRVLESPLTSDITASSQSGVQGQISITEPDVQPAQGLVELPEEVVDATRRVAQICPREPGAKPLGEFTITGRGSLPPSPLEALPGTSNTTKLATLDNSNTNVSNIAPNKVQNAIVEAQGWVKNKDGSFELVAMAPQTTPEARTSVAVCPS
ncbi:filamentous haemagglutinin outer membrane protein [Rivularia sp. IAM M-261]|nr:filamentous haemagglutinin outer membrane protein [Rivularia sp. IAM M-261]